MSFCCALSNETPEQPVVSPASGSLFERRLISKYIREHGTDPINGQPLTEDMLIDLKVAPIAKPRPPSATSVPALLKALQDEWDAVMLHSFSLRQQLQTARQELSHTLYQHDAACRVIARLTKEVTAAREALATLKPQAASSGGAAGAAVEAVPMETTEEAGGMTAEVVRRLQEKAALLTAQRKKRGKAIPEDLAKPEDLRAYQTLGSHPGLHSAGLPGILALDVSPTDRILTGGSDRNAAVFNKDTEQVVAVLKGHTKKVTSVVFHPDEDTAVTASPDTTVRVWNIPSAQTTQIIRAHEGPVSGLSLHATGDYLLSTSTDQHWAFSDLHTGRVLARVLDNCALTAAEFHPDGLILGTGTSDALVKIWDLKERTNVANFPGHTGSITALAFSENGYYLATAASDSAVKLWDLRKLKNFKTIALDDGYEVRDLYFDQSGTYLAVAGTDVRLYLCKQWDTLKIFSDHTALATGVRFTHRARNVASVSMDRTLKIYGLS
uniref:Pre-mRNA-processing factor 19 n=1 Tax=Rhipicephalus microplus TaxID=6941 RepID=A0A6M2CUZ1_RHIMP|nr:pre-mRNA-processing factor 19-like [Rhipicephalus microplus]XP_037284512.1 pre-mRNA-processing factor 19-like [Rhipicephalus microplus]